MFVQCTILTAISVVIPCLALAGLNAYNIWVEHWEHLPPLEERVEYPYQNIRVKNFPWGDGDKVSTLLYLLASVADLSYTVCFVSSFRLAGGNCSLVGPWILPWHITALIFPPPFGTLLIGAARTTKSTTTTRTRLPKWLSPPVKRCLRESQSSTTERQM